MPRCLRHPMFSCFTRTPTDTQTDGRTNGHWSLGRSIYRASIASCSKNWVICGVIMGHFRSLKRLACYRVVGCGLKLALLLCTMYFVVKGDERRCVMTTAPVWHVVLTSACHVMSTTSTLRSVRPAGSLCRRTSPQNSLQWSVRSTSPADCKCSSWLADWIIVIMA